MRRPKKQAGEQPARKSEELADGLSLNDLPITVGMLPDVVRVTRKFAAIEATTALDAARAAMNLVTLAINERRARDIAQDRANRRLLALVQLSMPKSAGFFFLAKTALDELEREERDHPIAGSALPEIDAQLRHLISELTRR